ncbi:histidine kinase, partial [Campylobacter jejuni]|nr:histidine kinase [Campylobacter jejuni]
CDIESAQELSLLKKQILLKL